MSTTGLRSTAPVVAIGAGLVALLFVGFHPLPHYHLCKAQDSIPGYQSFLARFPSSEGSTEVRERLRVLRDDEVWLETEQFGDLAAFRRYVGSYPDGKHLSDARAMASDLADSRWPALAGSRSEAELRSYLRDYPETTKRSEVEARLDALFNDLQWVREQDRIEYFLRFLADHPTHPQRRAIEKRIIDLEVDAIEAGDHGVLPPAEGRRSGQRSTNDIKIENGTAHVLTVRYSGKESTKVELEPGATSKFRLPNGSYRVAASVSASNVRAFYGTDEFEGGLYSIRFYIDGHP